MSQGIVPMLRSVLTVGVAVLLLTAAGEAIAAGPSGTWSGNMRSADGGEFSVEVILDGSRTSWSGTISDPEMGEVPLENLRVTATRISFTYRPEGGAIPAHFTGGYIAGDDRITGTFSLRGNSRFVKFDRVAGKDELGAAAALEPEAPLRARHPHRFGLTARAAYWAALHLVKDEVYNLNNLTTSEINFDLSLRYYVLDSFNIFLRGFRGGQGITDDPGRLAPFTSLGVSGNSYLKLDGLEFGVMGYLGGKMMRESRFNPYLTGAMGRTSWALHEEGRGSTVVVLDRDPLEGKDWSFALGLGTEFDLGQTVKLEFEWLWRYFLTKDEAKWPNSDKFWNNTHAWSLALGLTVGFW
jgi:opacity protein-like surface antigen